MVIANPKINQVWNLFKHHVDALKQETLVSLFAKDPHRVEALRFEVEGLSLDLSSNHLDTETLRHFAALAEACDVAGLQAKMLRGDKINITENRAVLHTALRKARDGSAVLVDGVDVMPEIFATQEAARRFVESVRSGAWKGATGKAIETVVNIGIGGSDLGPRLVVEALRDNVTLKTRFVANIDACDLIEAIEDLNPETTLFLVVSKSFTTEETLENARSARAWVVDALGEDSVERHFVAVSTNIDAVVAFGIGRSNIFPMWDWVGGRYSLWSAVGLSIALAAGWTVFEELLSGARAMDEHTQSAPLEKNLPFLLAMTGLMYRNLWDTTAQAILPYSHRLRSLPNYLQQADMESNGKSVSREGKPLILKTAPVLFGGCGTIFQHSFGQLLQQGTDIVPVDFIGVARDPKSPPHHHQALLANMRAQSRALREGRAVDGDLARTNPGNRPSSIIMLEALTPRTLGLLLALYEHKIFYQGAIWGLNSYDQFGVELGKVLAREEAKTGARVALSTAELARFFKKG